MLSLHHLLLSLINKNRKGLKPSTSGSDSLQNQSGHPFPTENPSSIFVGANSQSQIEAFNTKTIRGHSSLKSKGFTKTLMFYVSATM